MSNEDETSEIGAEHEGASRAEAEKRLYVLAQGLAFRFGSPEALRLLMNTALGLALQAIPKADTAAWLRQTADVVDQLQTRRAN